MLAESKSDSAGPSARYALMRFNPNKITAAGLIYAVALFACSVAPEKPTGSTSSKSENICTVDRSRVHEQLLGVLWVQTSAEYEMLALSTYKRAMAQLDEALADRTRTAALEQTGTYRDKPPAVIMDIDETVLNNSPFEAQLVLDHADFNSDAWTEWVKEAKANWVPGAKEFIEYATAKKIAVIFITNRTAEVEQFTRNNLSKLGYAVSKAPDLMLTRGEQPDWTSDKTSRRAHVADTYRVLQLIGDDFNDFVYAKGTPDERHAAIAPHSNRLGVDWFLIPNPLYGSWQRALYHFAPDCKMIEEKRSHLQGFR